MADTWTKAEVLQAAASELEITISKASIAEDRLMKAREIVKEAKETYLDRLGQAIYEQLEQRGLSYCRFGNHVVDDEAQVRYVVDEEDHEFHEILPICDACASRVANYKVEQTSTGWRALVNGQWEDLGEPGGLSRLRLMLYPKERQMEELAAQYDLTPPSHFAPLLDTIWPVG